VGLRFLSPRLHLQSLGRTYACTVALLTVRQASAFTFFKPFGEQEILIGLSKVQEA
jgi:hypothetical protein